MFGIFSRVLFGKSKLLVIMLFHWLLCSFCLFLSCSCFYEVFILYRKWFVFGACFVFVFLLNLGHKLFLFFVFGARFCFCFLLYLFDGLHMLLGLLFEGSLYVFVMFCFVFPCDGLKKAWMSWLKMRLFLFCVLIRSP